VINLSTVSETDLSKNLLTSLLMVKEKLGVAEDATPDEIKRTFLIAVKKYHPDVNKGKDAK